MNIDQALIQMARDIAADQYIRLELKRKTDAYSFPEWAKQVQNYSTFMREGAYDGDLAVVATLEALRMARLVAEVAA